MYKISIFNNGIETVIHYPDPSAPHVLEPIIRPKRGQASSLSFSMLLNSEGYDNITRFVTKVVAIDTRDDTEVFSGRVYTVKTSMTNDGKIKKDVVCESEMNYLQDSNVGSVIYEDKTVQEMLQTFLNIHNSQVEDYKQIQLGNVTVSDWILCTTSLETTLGAIQKYVVDSNKGYLQLRKVNGIKYLDYISSENSKTVDIKLGINMKELIVSDEQDFGTRIIPVGANDLTIESVNGGKNYLEDAEAVAKYGIIYKTVDYKDIDDDSQLMTQCQNDLSNYTKPTIVLDVTALDLNKLSGTTVIEPNSMDIGTTIHIVNPILGIDENYRIYEMEVELDKAWNPKLVISNKPVTLTSQINSLQATTIRNDGSYSGVQVGSSFGLRVCGDKNITTLNGNTAQIVRKSDGKKVIYTDDDGNLVLQDITAKEMRTSSDNGETIKVHDKYLEVYSTATKEMSIGFFTISGTTQAVPAIGFPNGNIHSYKNYGLNVYSNDRLSIDAGNAIYLDAKNSITFNAPSVKVNDKDIATQDWVENNYINSNQSNNYVNKSGDVVELPNGMKFLCDGESFYIFDSVGNKIFGCNKNSVAGIVPNHGYTQLAAN